MKKALFKKYANSPTLKEDKGSYLKRRNLIIHQLVVQIITLLFLVVNCLAGFSLCDTTKYFSSDSYFMLGFAVIIVNAILAAVFPLSKIINLAYGLYQNKVKFLDKITFLYG